MVGTRKKDRHLPSRVTIKHGAHYYIAPNGKWHRLGKEWDTATKTAWAKLSGEQAPSGTVADMLNQYMKHGTAKLEKATRDNHEFSVKPLVKVFGHMRPQDVTSAHCSQYLAKRTDKHGKPAPTRANRDLALLSSAYNYAMRTGYPGVEKNPCFGVRRNTERASTRYVTDDELKAAMDAANPKWRAIFQLLYSTGQRSTDIRNLTRFQLHSDGIHFEPSKTAKRTGKKVTILWKPELREAVKTLLDGQGKKPTEFVITALGNSRYTESGFKTEFRKVIDRAIKAGTLTQRFTIRDLRAKAASDDPEHAQKRLAHSSPAQTATYIRGRKPSEVDGL